MLALVRKKNMEGATLLPYYIQYMKEELCNSAPDFRFFSVGMRAFFANFNAERLPLPFVQQVSVVPVVVS